MAHALAANFCQGDLDAALLADETLVLHALVLAAQTLVVLNRAKDARAEEAVPLRLERAVVDRFRLLDLAERPRMDVVRARDRDSNLIERRQRRLRLEEVGHVIHRPSPIRGARRGRVISFRLVALKPVSLTGPAFGKAVSEWGQARRAWPRLILYSAAGGSCACGCSSSGPASCSACASEFISSTLRPSARISLTSTLKLSGTPASNASSPRTMAS